MAALLKLSILDQSPAAEGETAAEALQNTIELARRAEEWGYQRFWVAEHHGSNRHMGSSPEVLISHLLAHTSHIRVGSGGVMLQHYSPYKVAENFNVLSSLAPGRVDLGIGRGPGGMPISTQALRAQLHDNSGSGSSPGSSPGLGLASGSIALEDKLTQLRQFLYNKLDENNPFLGLVATPIPPQPPELFLLGTTASSAEIAARLSLPYVFAMFLNGDEEEMNKAILAYRESGGESVPEPMLALPVIVADTDREAAGYARDIHVVRIRLESGRTFTVFSEEAALEFGRQSGEEFTYEVQPANVIHGSPDKVKKRLSALRKELGVDEVFIVTAINSFRKRLHSYELLAEAMIGAPGNPSGKGRVCQELEE